jgi:hypothetical protein
MFEAKKPNKHNWCYKFLYWNNEENVLNFYTIETQWGFKYAENIAWNNAMWDGCRNMKYIGKNKMEVDNGTNA